MHLKSINIIFGIFFTWILPVLVFSQYNDFISFSNANATLAIIVDDNHVRHDLGNILQHFEEIFKKSIQKHLKIGGINVRTFSWKEIRLKKDILAAMTIMNCEDTWNFYESNQIANIFLMAITEAECQRLPMQNVLMIPTVTINKEFPQMILDGKVQQILRWHTTIVIMDNLLANENNKFIKSLMFDNIKRGMEPISTYFYTIDNSLKKQRIRLIIKSLLYTFRKPPRNSQQFLIFSQFYDDIIEIAENLEMFHIKNEWLIFILNDSRKHFDPMTTTQNLAEGANIAFVLNETNPQCVQHINCTMEELSASFLTALSKLMLAEESIHNEITEEEWEAIRYTKEEKLADIRNDMRNYLQTYSICASCSRWRIITAINWGKTQQHKDVLQIPLGNRNRNFEYIDVGYWTPTTGFVTEQLLYPHITHHFLNITLNVVTINNPPWQILKKDKSGNIIEHSGITMEILKVLSEILNFTYILHDADAMDFNGQTNLSGTLTYVIPHQVVDLAKNDMYFLIAVAATIDEPERKPFNFTIPISVQNYAFLTRRPDEVSRIYLFAAPFKNETWLALVVALLITSPVLYFLNRFVPLPSMKIEGFLTLKNCFWYTYGALLQQGGMWLPLADSTRLLIGLWWITVIVLVSSYCGNLVAFLTFPRFEHTANYLFQLFENDEYKELGLRNSTLFEKYAKLSHRSDLHKYVNNAIIYNNDQQQNMEGVLNGERINIDWEINLQLNIQNQFEKDKICRLMMGKETFLDEQIGLIIPRHSPYLELINSHIYRMQQMGFLRKWQQTYFPAMDKCKGKKGSKQASNHKVNLDDMQGCFLVLLFGFLVAISVISMEYFYHRWYTKTEQIRKKLFST